SRFALLPFRPSLTLRSLFAPLSTLPELSSLTLFPLWPPKQIDQLGVGPKLLNHLLCVSRGGAGEEVHRQDGKDDHEPNHEVESGGLVEVGQVIGHVVRRYLALEVRVDQGLLQVVLIQ